MTLKSMEVKVDNTDFSKAVIGELLQIFEHLIVAMDETGHKDEIFTFAFLRIIFFRKSKYKVGTKNGKSRKRTD